MQLFIDSIKNCLDEKGEAFIGLSGGNTPKPIFSIIADKHKYSVNWNKVYFFWVDERCVSPHDSESNFGSAKKLMLDYLPGSIFFPIDGNLSPNLAANLYEREIKQKLPFKKGFPVFDILMLGMGEDGHIASLFPDTKILNEDKRIVVPVWVNSKLGYRISLTFPVLNNSLVRIFTIFGQRKFDFFLQIKNSKKAEYPIQMLDFTKGENNFIIGK